MLGKKSNQQMVKVRIKKNYKPKANDKGKENNAIFFETWPSLCRTCRTSHVLENISSSAANHSKIQSGNKKPREISEEV